MELDPRHLPSHLVLVQLNEFRDIPMIIEASAFSYALVYVRFGMQRKTRGRRYEGVFANARGKAMASASDHSVEHPPPSQS